MYLRSLIQGVNLSLSWKRVLSSRGPSYRKHERKGHPAPKEPSGSRKQHKHSSEGMQRWPGDESGWQTELAASQRAAGAIWGSCITSVIHPAIYHAEGIRGPSLMWSSTRTGVFKHAPNKIFLGCVEPWSLCSLEVSHQLDKCGSAA